MEFLLFFILLEGDTLLVEYKTDKKKGESYAEWISRKRLVEHYVLTIFELCRILRVSRSWVYRKLRKSCYFIMVHGTLFYQVDSVEAWLMKHSVYTVQTRVLNLLDYCTMESLNQIEVSTKTKHYVYAVPDINGRIQTKTITGYMPEKLLKGLSLPSYSLLYYNRPSFKETPVKPFKYLFKRKIFPKDAGTLLADNNHKFHEQFYREAFMFGYCKIRIDDCKTIWVPLKFSSSVFILWTIPATVTVINKVPLKTLEDSDFEDDRMLINEIFPFKIVNSAKKREAK